MDRYNQGFHWFLGRQLFWPTIRGLWLCVSNIRTRYPSIPTPNSDTSSIRSGPLDLIRVQCLTRVDCASFWSQFILSWNGHIDGHSPISIVFFAHTHRYIDRKYDHKLLSVIGVGWPDYGECDDQDRISFLRSHLRECIKAITHDKVNLYGFTGTKSSLSTKTIRTICLQPIFTFSYPSRSLFAPRPL